MSEESIKVTVNPLIGELFDLEVPTNITVREFYQKVSKDSKLEENEKINLYYFPNNESKILDEFLNEPLSKFVNNENNYYIELDICKKPYAWLRKVVGAIGVFLSIATLILFVLLTLSILKISLVLLIVLAIFSIACDVLYIFWDYIRYIFGKLSNLEIGQKKETKEIKNKSFSKENEMENLLKSLNGSQEEDSKMNNSEYGDSEP